MIAEKYIKADEIIPVLKSLSDDTTCPIHIAAELDQIVELAEPVEAKLVVHAKWIKHWHNSLIGHEYEECSNCGCTISDTEKFWDCTYCPNCGSTMDGNDNVFREED